MPKTSQILVKQGTPATIHLMHGEYLSNKIASLPAGIIDKRYPGIGATTLEIEDSSRNSIIVFPTRALAATKAEAKSIHYYGSSYVGVKVSAVEKIIEDAESGLITKIAIVADSLVNVYDKLKDTLHAYNFFIMLDEIDTFQTESSYRPKLEECIDIYLEFPQDLRCLVSATLEQFSDRRLRSEPRTTIIIDNNKSLEIKVINATNSVIKVAAQEIIKVYQPGMKVFIAFNSIEGILKVLKLLPKNLVSEAGILCSTDSQDKIMPYHASAIKDGLLQHGITFLTSAYFVGLDVLEPADTVHAIILADTSLPVSLVTDSKVRQIFGRIRNNAATRTIILNCTDRPYLSINNFREELDKRQKVYEKVLDTIHDSFGTIDLQDEGREIETIMLDTCRVDNICLLRRLNNRVVISASNFDYLRIRHSALKRLYSNFRNTVRNLQQHFDVQQVISHTDLDQAERVALADVELLLRDDELSNRQYVLENGITDSRLAKGNANVVITQIWGVANNTIDKNKVRSVIKALPAMTVKELNKILFQVRVFSEKEDSPLWKHINLNFKIGERYTAGEIFRGITSVRKVIGYNSPFIKYNTNNQALQRINLIFETQKKKNKATGEWEFLFISTYRNIYCK